MSSKVSRKSRRTLPVSQAEKLDNISPIRVEDMILKSPKSTSYFQRLKYKGCPKLSSSKLHISTFSADTELIDMKRDLLIRELWIGFNTLKNPASASAIFGTLTKYFAFLDHEKIEVNFNETNMFLFIEHLMALVKKGNISENTFSINKSYLSVIFKLINKEEIARKLPPTRNIKHTQKPHKGFTTSELKLIAKVLLKANMVFTKHYLSNTTPLVHPFFDYERLQKINKTPKEINIIRGYMSQCLNNQRGDWRNHMISVAIMLTFMFTGLNTTPLLNMKRRDVKFKRINGDTFTLETIKGRALYQQQSNDIGFTKRAKEFLEQWMIISAQLSNHDEEAPLFPTILENGQIAFWKKNNPQERINKQLVRFDYPRISASRFRKTKSDLIMQTTNDVLVVANANNTSINTTAKDYLYGIESVHQRSLTSALTAQESIARGVNKKEAINQALFTVKDPLSDFDYKKIKGHSEPNKTPTGMRCNNPVGSKAIKNIKSLKKAGLKLEASINTCTDFLSCFECDDHMLIAESDDIWLMLSFHDSIRETLTRPALNSKPSDRFTKILNTVKNILHRYKHVSPNEYQIALEKHEVSPHPLYDDEFSITDLLDVYG